MLNSKDQLIRVMTLGLVFGALLFILAAEVNHLKSSQESEEDDATIYIQEDGVTAVDEHFAKYQLLKISYL